MANSGKKVFRAEKYFGPDQDAAFDEAALAARLGAAPGNGIDTGQIMAAIEGLRGEIAELKSASAVVAAKPAPEAPAPEEDADVRIEIAQMVRSIGKAKTELAAIKHPMVEDDRIKSASSELDEIVIATETATQDILRSTEHIGELLDEILARNPTDEKLFGLTEEAGQELVNIMESCSFQDITGQRVNKVVKTIQFIQDRILAMIGIWGADAFADLPVKEQEESTGDEALLSGPATGNEGLNQADIDALFD